MVVGEDAAVDFRCSKAGEVGRIHPVADALWLRPVRSGNGRLEIDDADIWPAERKLPERVAPDVSEGGRAPNRPIPAFGQRDVIQSRANVRLHEPRRAGMRQDLIDPSTKHHVATQHNSHLARDHKATFSLADSLVEVNRSQPRGPLTLLVFWSRTIAMPPTAPWGHSCAAGRDALAGRRREALPALPKAPWTIDLT